MSRSIHTTNQDIVEAQNYDYANPAEKRATVRRLRSQFIKKHRIKWLVTKGRREAAPLSAPVSPDTVLLTCRDTSPFVHYPASVEDIRAVLRLLPPGLLNGLTEIELCLGESFQLPKVEKDTVYDPFTGRASQEILPGIYSGHTLGHYYSRSAKIRLFAYVYDRSTTTDPDIWELLLRLYSLSTLMHEIGHHFDYMARVARGRWRADQTEAKEIFARQQEYDWLQTYVIPYLEQTYPQEIDQLNNWMEEKLGVVLPLIFLSGDPRTRARGNRITTVGLWGTTSAIQKFVTSAIKGEEINEARFHLALNFHRTDRNVIATSILDVVLKEQPEDLKVFIQQADVLTELGEYPSVEALLDKVFSLDENYFDAWKQAVRLAEAKKDWNALILAANRALELNPNHSDQAYLIGRRGLAFLELGRFEEASLDMDFIIKSGHRWAVRWAKQLQARLPEALR